MLVFSWNGSYVLHGDVLITADICPGSNVKQYETFRGLVTTPCLTCRLIKSVLCESISLFCFVSLNGVLRHFQQLFSHTKVFQGKITCTAGIFILTPAHQSQ